MTINVHCLKHLQGLGLPMEVEVVDVNGDHVTNATIDEDGSVTNIDPSPNGVVRYSSPSALRHDLVQADGHTYKRFIYRGEIKDYVGRNLNELGVVPRPEP